MFREEASFCEMHSWCRPWHGEHRPCRRASLADFGGYYAFSKHFQILFAAGHCVFWAPEIYTYAAAYWTCGKGGEEAGCKTAEEAPGGKNGMLFHQATY